MRKILLEKESEPYLESNVDYAISCLIYHPTLSNVIILGRDNGTISILEISANPPTVIHQLIEHTASICYLNYISEGNYLISCDVEGKIVLWNTIGSQPQITDSYQLPPCNELIQNDKFLVTLGRDGMSYWLNTQPIVGTQLPHWRLQWRSQHVLDTFDVNIHNARLSEDMKVFVSQHNRAPRKSAPQRTIVNIVPSNVEGGTVEPIAGPHIVYFAPFAKPPQIVPIRYTFSNWTPDHEMPPEIILDFERGKLTHGASIYINEQPFSLVTSLVTPKGKLTWYIEGKTQKGIPIYLIQRLVGG